MGSNAKHEHEGTRTKSASALSCVACRLSFVSCDGKQPCGRCMTLNQGNGCFRVPPQPRGRPRTRRKPGTPSEPPTLVNIRPAAQNASSASSAPSPAVTPLPQPPPIVSMMPQIVTPWFMQLPLPLIGLPSLTPNAPSRAPSPLPVVTTSASSSPSTASPLYQSLSPLPSVHGLPRPVSAPGALHPLQHAAPSVVPLTTTVPMPRSPATAIQSPSALGSPTSDPRSSPTYSSPHNIVSDKKRPRGEEEEILEADQPHPAKQLKAGGDEESESDDDHERIATMSTSTAIDRRSPRVVAVKSTGPNDVVLHSGLTVEMLLHFPFLREYNLSGKRFVGENLDKPLLVVSLGITKKPSIMFANPAFCDLLGYSLVELLDIQPWLLDWDIKVRVLSVMSKPWQKMGVSSVERAHIEFVHKDASRLQVETNVQWFFGSDSMIRCAIGCIDRVTGVQLPPWTIQELADTMSPNDRTQRIVRYREQLRQNESNEWKRVEAAYAHLMPSTHTTDSPTSSDNNSK